MSVICKVEALKKSFQPDFYKKPIQVLKNIHFEIHEGRFVGFIGPNGSGKTTTIKCLMQFIFPDEGKIVFFNSEDMLSAKKRIGFLPERPYFQEFLTGTEFLKLHWDLAGMKAENFHQKSQDILKMVKLSHAQDKKLKDYSKGMLQRIGIAQALLTEPDLLILDEPMSGLDPDGRILIKGILKDLKKKNMTVIMSSHLLEDLEELCEDLIIINKGETLFNGTVSEFKKDNNSLESAYKIFKGQIEENHNA